MGRSLNGSEAELDASVASAMEAEDSATRSFRRQLGSIQSSVTDAMLLDVINSGRAASLRQVLLGGYGVLVEERFRKQWTEAAAHSTELVQSSTSDLDHDWSGLPDLFEQAWDARSSELLASFVDKQLQSVAYVLKQLGTVTPMTSDVLMLVLHLSIGLNGPQAMALVALCRHLVADEEKSRTAPHLHKSVISALKRRAATFLSYRSRLMAVSEIVKGYAVGALESVKDLVRKGSVEGEVRRRWVALKGACSLCVDLMSGPEIPLGGTYPGGLRGPPAHGSCRCGENFYVV